MNNIIKTIAIRVPAVIPYLSGRARWIANTPMEYKTYDYFLQQVERLVHSVYTGRIGGDFIDLMANLISGQLTQAYEQAWKDEGEEGELPEFLATPLEDMILNQYDHVDQYYRDIVDVRVDKESIDSLLVRATMWANQWTTAYEKARLLINTQGGGNLVWRKGATEHGCDTCANLDGIVARAVEWEQLGVHPREYPNSKLQCGGGGPGNFCDCTLEPTDQRRSRDAYGRIEEIIL